MKVPPPKTLIVCVKPPQTIVRQCVLAAVSYVSALCGAANAQSAPAAPTLFVDEVVVLTHGTASEKTHLIERSADMESWLPATTAYFGDGNDLAHTLLATTTKKGNSFFRLRSDTLPSGGNAPWRIEDRSMLLNSLEGPRSLIFNGNGAGVMLQGVTNEPVTWTWRRSGLDTGVCVVTRASGEVETIDMNFAAAGSGSFAGRREKAGIPTGFSSGTFRNVSDSSLTTFAPSAIGHALVTFSGTGRAVTVEVKGDGTASSPGPSGPVNTSCTYNLRGVMTADLKMNSGAPDSDLYVLEFNGPSCGTYVLKTKKKFVLRREAAGTFTIATQ